MSDIVFREMPIVSQIPRIRPEYGWAKSTWAWVAKTDNWRIEEDWYFELPIEYGKIVIMIPEGFICDGASIPRAFHRLIHPNGVMFRAGIIHDFCYRRGYLLNANGDKIMTDMTRSYADLMFKDVGHQTTHMKFIPWACWSQLAMWGWIAWEQSADLRREHGALN